MSVKIIDNRVEKSNYTFSSLIVGDFFQGDNGMGYAFDDTICMKTSDDSAVRFLSSGDVDNEYWGDSNHLYSIVYPLKATITVERGE